ncbi:Uncharacterised protein [Mycobacteroides abscessus subsp. abscessus]|nr:Uncharacterised protein [Mycobacteroides abscessus subsp. abscessus]
MLELNAIQPRGAKTVVRDTPPKIDPLKPIHRATMNNDVAAFRAEVAAGVDINLPAESVNLFEAPSSGIY